MRKSISHANVRAALLYSALSMPVLVMAQDYPSSLGKDAGDHLRLTTDVYGFVPVSTAPGVDRAPRCAGKGSTYSIVTKTETHTVVRFHDTDTPASIDTCGKDSVKPVVGSLYEIANDSYAKVQVKTTGISYGALVVPFKFRLGGDKKLISSSTIAPYMGVRWGGFQGWGYELVPVLSAGLGLVPIVDEASKSTETKTAFSAAGGFTVTTIKDSKFSAGILFGRDYLSAKDRAIDPQVDKPWVSLWLGVAL